jgi:hypothetical protein
MCGLDISLVQGAHIYPASAPGAWDDVWNGLALCANHHVAFDRHLVGVRTPSGDIRFRQEVIKQGAGSQAVRRFIETTYSRLQSPVLPGAEPRAEMFEKRYHYFDGQYDWL